MIAEVKKGGKSQNRVGEGPHGHPREEAADVLVIEDKSVRVVFSVFDIER